LVVERTAFNVPEDLRIGSVGMDRLPVIFHKFSEKEPLGLQW